MIMMIISEGNNNDDNNGGKTEADGVALLPSARHPTPGPRGSQWTLPPSPPSRPSAVSSSNSGRIFQAMVLRLDSWSSYFPSPVWAAVPRESGACQSARLSVAARFKGATVREGIYIGRVKYIMPDQLSAQCGHNPSDLLLTGVWLIVAGGELPGATLNI